MQAFKAVETAKQGAQTAENNANQYKNEKIPAAEASADKITQGAARIAIGIQITVDDLVIRGLVNQANAI